MDRKLPDRKIELPEKVKWIIRRLEEAGFEAYAVGGCVRDTLLGRIPDDWDITTNAQPRQMKALFRKTIDTGIQHGTVTVLLDREGFEVTTYRIDGKYEDARHPKEVTFTGRLEEDLKRRDFTINAMAYNDRSGLVDLFGGAADLEKGIIRCVGNAEERFSEDALRMMRAIRFSAQLGYEIEADTQQAICKLSGNLCRISAERIQAELNKLVVSPHPERLRTAGETGILKVILPELQQAMETPQNHPHHCYSVGEHILHAMQQSEAVKELRLALMLHDIGKPLCLTVDEKGTAHFYGHAQISADLAREILKRLKYDNHTVDIVHRLVLYHDYGNGVCPDQKTVRRAVNKIGEDLFPMLLAVRRADILAQSGYLRKEKLENLEEWRKIYEEIVKEGQCVSLKTLAITGKDLIAMGMSPGREMGEVLEAALRLVLERPECNNREILQEWVLQNHTL